jgi:MFS transporter, FLVCR family, MFS-domain-containing protein 7
MIIAGLIGAFVAAPLFDRVFTRHLAFTAKVIVPMLAVAWLSLIWDGALRASPRPCEG